MSQKDVERLKGGEGTLGKERRRKGKRTRQKRTPDCPAGHKHVAIVKDTHRMPVENTVNIDQQTRRHGRKGQERNIMKEKNERSEEDKRKGNSRLP